jgi:hypothetical protein
MGFGCYASPALADMNLVRRGEILVLTSTLSRAVLIM